MEFCLLQYLFFDLFPVYSYENIKIKRRKTVIQPGFYVDVERGLSPKGGRTWLRLPERTVVLGECWD
jgi:hypothetical protein